MERSLIHEYDASRQIAHQPFHSACYAPFVSLYFHTNGDVVACCKSAHYRLGNVARESLRDIWRGERIAALRDALRRDDFGDACRFCEWQVANRHEHVHAKIFDELPADTGDELWPARMDFTLSNTCNLACVMCYGELSSTIRAHRDRLPPLPRAYGDAFFADLRPFLARLRRATFMGGEPFLAAENHRIWDALIEDGIRLPSQVITNGTQWNARVERVLDALPVDVSVSIDGVTKATVESIRVNARFDVVMANAARFRDYARRRGTRMSLMFCLMQQNWHEFGGYLRLADEMDVDVDLNVVVSPEQCSLHSLTPTALAEVVAQLELADRGERFAELRRNGWLWRRTLDDLRRELQSHRDGRADHLRPPAATPDPVGAAWRRIQAGDPAGARALLADDRAFSDRRYDALVCRAHAERACGDHAAADATLAEAIRCDDGKPAAWLERGWLRLEQRRGDEARADALAARDRLAMATDRSAATAVQRILGAAANLLGDTDGALAALREVPHDDPDTYDVAIDTAWISRAAQRFDVAQAAIDRARAMAPERPAAWLEQAWLDHARGRDDDALRAADAALARIPPDRLASEGPGVHAARAVAARARGDFAGARSAFAELLRLRPGDTWAAAQVQQLAAADASTTPTALP